MPIAKVNVCAQKGGAAMNRVLGIRNMAASPSPQATPAIPNQLGIKPASAVAHASGIAEMYADIM